MTHPLPHSDATVELLSAPDPGIVRFNRWASAVALILGIILMTMMLFTIVWAASTLGEIATRMNTDTSTPGPLITGCPFGDTECGG
jgi:hypothetical protein